MGSNCSSCCGEEAGTSTIVVLGSSGSGATTVCRRLRGPREEIGPAPMPSVSIDLGPVPLRRRSRLLRFVDAGPCTTKPPPARPRDTTRSVTSSEHELQPGAPENAVRPVIAGCRGVILVLDASRSLDEQGAASVMALLNRTKAREKPLAVLLTKFDVATSRTLATFLTPTVVSSALQLEERKAPWVCHPCVAVHPRLDLSRVVEFILHPEDSKSDGSAPAYGRQQSPGTTVNERLVGKGCSPLTAASGTAGYVEYVECDRDGCITRASLDSRAPLPKTGTAAPVVRARGYQRLARK